LAEAQEVFLDLIVRQQVADIAQGIPASNRVAVSGLSRDDRERLREALGRVRHLDIIARDLLFAG
jgi:DNA polymerase-3 subunit epsilon/CBS domain-containing protein